MTKDTISICIEECCAACNLFAHTSLIVPCHAEYIYIYTYIHIYIYMYIYIYAQIFETI